MGVAPGEVYAIIQNSPSPLCLDHIFLRRFWGEKLAGERLGEPLATVRERVAAARTVQAKRFKGTWLLTNADMGSAEVAIMLNNQFQLQLPADGLRALPARTDHWVDNQPGVSDISVEASSAPNALSRP